MCSLILFLKKKYTYTHIQRIGCQGMRRRENVDAITNKSVQLLSLLLYYIVPTCTPYVVPWMATVASKTAQW